MVPLQARWLLVSLSCAWLRASSGKRGDKLEHTELLLDDLQNLLLVKLLGKTLNSGQSLTTIALYSTKSACVSCTLRAACLGADAPTMTTSNRGGKIV